MEQVFVLMEHVFIRRSTPRTSLGVLPNKILEDTLNPRGRGRRGKQREKERESREEREARGRRARESGSGER